MDRYSHTDNHWVTNERFTDGFPHHLVKIFNKQAAKEGHDLKNYYALIVLKEALDTGWRS